MENTSIAIKTNDLTKRFGKRNAVDAINIEINHGEIFSLLGKNGAGKTTTIKMLCCLLRPSSGSAEIMGYDIRKSPLEIKRIIGVSPQETAIAGHLNTKENLLLIGGVFGLKRGLSIERAKNLMELMELEDRKDQAQKLSGGMQIRLSIAIALMSEPQILFLDEPTLGLDPHARKSVWNYINKLKREKTILLTTHYMEEADSLADHIAIIDNAQIITSGTSAELKHKHESIQSLKISADDISSDILDGLKNKGMEVISTMNSIVINSVELDFYSIINYLQTKNIKIKGIQMQEPTLEEVFLHLTRKEVKNENH
ncbi:MAG: ATP-binding cassette domain-containing protein [Bacteroidia bacterium]|nr:ATP-binding cassette domain-containing protein [Bacteroidia bacterium]